MDVAFRAGDLAGGEFQDSCKSRGVKITRRADLNPRIAGLCDERRQPADFEFEADDDEQLGLGELQKKAGLGIDKMRVLITARDGFYVNSVSTDFLRTRGQDGGYRHDAHFTTSVHT